MASAKRQHVSEDASLDNDAEAIQELENIQQKLDQVGCRSLPRLCFSYSS